jgi:hypothetical protein
MDRRTGLEGVKKCKGFEQFRPLGYRNPVRSSEETHYVSAIESSRLMLCKI